MSTRSLTRLLLSLSLVVATKTVAWADCALPYQLQNGEPADATKVMANYNALLTCVNAIVPGGVENSIQYNSGSGTLAGLAPLTDGQLVIGSTGSPPVANTLTAGQGIQIDNGPGTITISALGQNIQAEGRGLYSGVMSTTPTSASTGLGTWVNQGTAAVSDSAVGININALGAGGTDKVSARSMAAPSPPYKITALVSATRNSPRYDSVGIGWYDGTNKLHLIAYGINGSGVPLISVVKLNNPSSYSSDDFLSAGLAFSQPIWLQIADDGTSVSFGFSQDGSNFLTVFTVAKASGWLGANGYSNALFFVNPVNSQNLATLMSWTLE